MSLFICGTDTAAGKTCTAAALMSRFAANNSLRYWKPIQTGSEADSDRDTVASLTSLPGQRFLPVAFSFRAPLSPHRAAELEQRRIELPELIRYLEHYRSQGPLLIEGAGGLLVPLNRRHTWLDFLRQSSLPVLVVGRSGLGTINHSLLTIATLKSHSVEVVGIVFFGPLNEDNMRTVGEFSGIPLLGRVEFREGRIVSADLDREGILEARLRGGGTANANG